MSNRDAAQYSPVTLAFIGDSVYELLVRYWLVSKGDRRMKDFNTQAISFVRSESQQSAIEKLKPFLHEDELAIFRRGRNAKNTTARDAASHRVATGFEALLGYLYLTGKDDRIAELFNMIVTEI